MNQNLKDIGFVCFSDLTINVRYADHSLVSAWLSEFELRVEQSNLDPKIKRQTGFLLDVIFQGFESSFEFRVGKADGRYVLCSEVDVCIDVASFYEREFTYFLQEYPKHLKAPNKQEIEALKRIIGPNHMYGLIKRFMAQPKIYPRGVNYI